MTEVDKLDVLAVGAHPDDVELGCGGTICKMVEGGYRVGVVDLTRGELGSRGTAVQRTREAAKAGEIMGIRVRENLEIPDGQIRNSLDNRLKLIEVVRKWRPEIVLIGSPECRHPDHEDATRLCVSALFASGLRKIATVDTGESQTPWRPSHTLHYMQGLSFEPTFVVDVTSVWEQRVAAIRAYESQFHNPGYRPESDEPETYISDPGFIVFLEGRAKVLGYRTGASYGEGFLYRHGPVGVDDLVSVLGRTRRV